MTKSRFHHKGAIFAKMTSISEPTVTPRNFDAAETARGIGTMDAYYNGNISSARVLGKWRHGTQPQIMNIYSENNI